MHQQRISVAFTAVFGLFSAFVPWLSGVPWYGSLNGLKVEGGTGGMVLSAVVCAGMFVGRRNAPLTPGGRGLCRLAGGFIVLVAIYAMGRLDEIGAGSYLGPGPYLTMVVGVAIAVLPNVVTGPRSGTARSTAG